MISADTPFDQKTVADHYDDLDLFYRELWGEHVHHGFWTTGAESPEIAVQRLVELERVAEAAGFVIVESRDCTQAVRPTWGIILRRLVEHLLVDPRYRAFLLDGRQSNRVFALTALRIWLAYKIGAMRYGILTVTRPF